MKTRDRSIRVESCGEPQPTLSPAYKSWSVTLLVAPVEKDEAQEVLAWVAETIGHPLDHKPLEPEHVDPHCDTCICDEWSEPASLWVKLRVVGPDDTREVRRAIEAVRPPAQRVFKKALA